MWPVSASGLLTTLSSSGSTSPSLVSSSIISSPSGSGSVSLAAVAGLDPSRLSFAGRGTAAASAPSPSCAGETKTAGRRSASRRSLVAATNAKAAAQQRVRVSQVLLPRAGLPTVDKWQQHRRQPFRKHKGKARKVGRGRERNPSSSGPPRSCVDAPLPPPPP